MNLEVLISTMNIGSQNENEKLVKDMNITGESLTISQCGKNGDVKGKNRIIYDNKKGLSRSRNMAVENAVGNIILIADDDVKYVKDYEEIILESYRENPEADMIAFFVESKNNNRKVRKLKSGKIGWIRIFRVCSFQLTFKRASIIKNNLKFDEDFGAGTQNYCGEETIFLSDCLRMNMKLTYVDKKIGEVEQKESTWYKGFSREYMNVEKECFKRIAPKMWPFLWIQFLIRKAIPNKIKRAKIIGFWY